MLSSELIEIGHRGGSGHWYNGLLDEIAVFSVALDEDQVKEASGNIDEALFTLTSMK